MNKRNLASVLWLAAGWSGGGLLTYALGLPDALAIVPGIVMAVLVRVDPGGFMWGRTGTGRRISRRVVPADQFAAELDKQAGTPSGIRATSKRV
jgi:hypothetical protein